MALKHWIVYAGVVAAVLPFSATADLALELEIPRLQVAEYHRPYVAVWVETYKGRHQQNLVLWYEVDMADNEGTKWLKDLRLWWRRSGREQSFPVDGYSGATRPAGFHQLTFSAEEAPLKELPPGSYRLVVEAAREVGGREMIQLPFEWPVRSPAKVHQQGEHELGRVQLTSTP